MAWCSCGKRITWLKTREGASIPVSGSVSPWPPGGIWFKELGSHWADCPDREAFRKDAPAAPRHPRGFFLDLRQLADTIDGVDIYLTGAGSSWSAFWKSGSVPVSSHGHATPEDAIEAARTWFGERVLMPWPPPEPTWSEAFAAWPVDDDPEDVAGELLEQTDDQAPELEDLVAELEGLDNQQLIDLALAPADEPGTVYSDKRDLTVLPACNGRGAMFIHTNLPLVEMHVAGSCAKQRGPGGWACVLVSGERVRTLSGRLESTTLIQLTWLAVLEGFRVLQRRSFIEVYTSCKQVSDGMGGLQSLNRAQARGIRICGVRGKPSKTDRLEEGVRAQMRRHEFDVCCLLGGPAWSDHDAKAHDLARAEALAAETLMIEGKQA